MVIADVLQKVLVDSVGAAGWPPGASALEGCRTGASCRAFAPSGRIASVIAAIIRARSAPKSLEDGALLVEGEVIVPPVRK
jgi:hypothetical protein